MSSWTYMNLKGQGHSLTLVQGHSDSIFSFFFLETAWPTEAKFYVEPPWDWAAKIWLDGQYHTTKLVAMPTYGKNLKKSSSLESKGGWPWKLVCSIGYLSTSKLDQMMSMGWPWPVLCQGQIWSLMLLYGEKGKTIDFFQKLL